MLKEIVLEGYREKPNDKPKTLVTYGFNFDKTIITVRNANLIDEKNNIEPKFISGWLIMNYYNQYTEAIESFGFLKSEEHKSVFHLFNSHRKDDFRFYNKNILPTTHSYFFSYEDLHLKQHKEPIHKINEVMERFTKLKEELPDKLSKDAVPQQIKKELKEKVKNDILTKNDYLKIIGFFVYHYTKLETENGTIEDFIASKPTEFFEENTLDIFNRFLGKRVLKDMFGVEIKMEATNEIEKKAEEFVKTLNIDYSKSKREKLKEYLSFFLNNEEIEYSEDYKEIDHFFKNVLKTIKTINEMRVIKNPDLVTMMIGRFQFFKLDFESLKDIEDFKMDIVESDYLIFKKIEGKLEEEINEYLNKNPKAKDIYGLKIYIDENNERYLTNFYEEFEKNLETINLSDKKLHNLSTGLNKKEDYGEYLINRINLIYEELKTVKNHINLVKKRLIDLLYQHSPIKNLTLTEKILPNIYEKNGNKVSIMDVINNIYLADLYREIILYSVIKTVLERNGIKYPKSKSLTLDLTDMSVKKPDNFLEISKDNLGMRRFKYLPLIKIETKEAKERFIKKIKKHFPDIKDGENLEKIVNNSNFVAITTEKKINENNFVIDTMPLISLHNEKGETVGTLNMDIFEYLDFFESEIEKVNTFVEEPKFEEKLQYQLISSIANQMKGYYAHFLGERDITKAVKLAKVFLYKDGKTVEVKGTDKTNAKYFIELEFLMAEKLLDFKILEEHLNDITNIINGLNIDPIDRKRLEGYFKSIKSIYVNQEEINTLLIDIQVKNTEDREKMKDAVERIIKDITEIKKFAKKEARSFIYIYKILNNLNDILKSKDFDDQVLHLLSAKEGFRKWGIEAVGLSEEQFKDALNAILIMLQKKVKSVNFFYDMGTGKTRLALFTAILKSALFPNETIAFAIQNKNATDIYEQLRDMLPSLLIFVNKNFKGKNFVNNVEMPFAITDNLLPNFTTPSNSKIFITNPNRTKQEIIKEYYNDLREVLSLLEGKKISELKNEAKHVQKILNVPFDNIIQKAYKETIGEQLSKIDNPFKKEHFSKITFTTYRNYLASLILLASYKQTGNLTNEANKKISEKIYDDIKKIFANYIDYLLHQKDKKIMLLPNNIISNMPLKKEIEIKEGTITTKNKIDGINYSVMAQPTDIKSKLDTLSYIYKNINETIIPEDKIFLVNSVDVKTFIEDALYKIHLFETNEKEEFILNGEEDSIEKMEDKNDYVKINGSYATTNILTADIIKEVFEANKEIIKEVLNVETPEDFGRKINKFYLAYIYYVYTVSDLQGIEKIMAVSNKKQSYSVSNIELAIPLKEIEKMPFDGKKGFMKLFEAFKKTEKYIENGTIKYKVTKPQIKEIILNYKNSKEYIELKFNTEKNIKYNINLNTTLIIEPDTNKRVTYIIDEAHKNATNKLKIKEAVTKNDKNIIIQLTGTPTKGDSASLAQTTHPLADEEELKLLKNNLVLLGGIGKIKSEFFKLLYSIEDEKDRVEILKTFTHIIMANPSLPVRDIVVKVIEDLRYKMATKIINEKKVGKILKYYDFEDFEKMVKELKEGNGVTKLFENLKEALKEKKVINEAFLRETFLKGKNALEAMPGISNPRIVNILPDHENIYAIKTQKGRVYNLIDIEKIKNGDYKSQRLSESDIRLNGLDDFRIMLEVAKQQEFIKYVKTLSKLIDYMAEIIINSEDFEKMIEYINKRNYDCENIDLKSFGKNITPETSSGKDTLGFYFKELFFFKKDDIPEEKINIIENLVKFILKIRKDKELESEAMVLGFVAGEAMEQLYNELDFDNFISFDFDFRNKNIYLTEKGSKKTFIANTELIFNLKNYFPDVLTDDTKIKFNFLNPQTEEIINDFYNEAVMITTENLTQKDKNTLFYTTRTKSLILKTLQLLQSIYQEKTDKKPLYVLVNMPGSGEIKEIFNNIDVQKLKEKKIKVVFTNTMKIYNDYNYGIPQQANILIISNYKALAEGYRFPRIKEVIFTGKPNDIPTILQASARCFLPGKVFKTDIRLTTPELFTGISFTLPLFKGKKELFISKFINNFNKSTRGEYWETAKRITETETGEKVLIKEQSKKRVPKAEEKRLKALAESVITSLRFIGSEIGGMVTRKNIDNIVKDYNVALADKTELVAKFTVKAKPKK